MREDVSFESVVEDLEVHNAQELFDTVEIEDREQTLGEVKLRLQEFV
jgi:hypothetical protein